MYFLKRFFLIIPTFFCIMGLNFFIIHNAPGDPVAELLNQNDINSYAKMRFKTNFSDEELIQNLRKDFDLDKPLPLGFWRMIKKYAQGDFGYSYFKGQSVAQLIQSRLKISLTLGLCSTFFTFVLALFLGILKAIKNTSLLDRVSTFVLGGFYAIPPFVTALIFIVWFQGCFFVSLKEPFSLGMFVLPVMTLVLHSLMKPTLLMKTAIIEELNKPYVLVVKAKGASSLYILFHHCVKNAFLVMISSLTYVFLFTFFFGTLMIEVLFSLEGLASLSFEAIANRDYPLILGCLYVYSLFGILSHIVSDGLYSVLDKRVQLEKVD